MKTKYWYFVANVYLNDKKDKHSTISYVTKAKSVLFPLKQVKKELYEIAISYGPLPLGNPASMPVDFEITNQFEISRASYNFEVHKYN